jgi:hypothetical protein
MTHTDLSAEEPSERAATGPQLLRCSWEAKAEGPGGTSLEAKGEIQAPPGGVIETAVAFFIVFAGAVLLPAGAAAILATTSMVGWVVGAIAAAVLVAYVATATIVVTRKGLPKG